MKLTHLCPFVAFAVLAVASPSFAAKPPAAPVSFPGENATSSGP